MRRRNRRVKSTRTIRNRNFNNIFAHSYLKSQAFRQRVTTNKCVDSVHLFHIETYLERPKFGINGS